jgi:hypothetical protein
LLVLIIKKSVSFTLTFLCLNNKKVSFSDPKVKSIALIPLVTSEVKANCQHGAGGACQVVTFEKDKLDEVGKGKLGGE